MANTKTVDELMADLGNVLASPVARMLRSYILDGKRAKAYAVLQDEGFDATDCTTLYQHLRKELRGATVTFVELAKKERPAAVASALSAKTPVAFLVRRGCDLFQATPYARDGTIEFFAPDSSFISLARVDQLWRIVSQAE